MSLLVESDSSAVTVRAAAKINLFLGVGPVREDGFHPLETVYQAIGLYDDVTVTDAPEWSVHTAADAGIDLATVPDGDANIAIRAGRALAAHHDLGLTAHIEIHKGIPVAGGLAGGSADAAATLVALDRLWDLRTTDEDLLAIAGELGSDVPFALIGGSAHGLGHGELVTPLPDHGSYWWVVVPSDEGLSTPEVYREFDRLQPDLDPTAHEADPVALIGALREGDPDRLATSMRNDLEDAALSLRPELAERFALVQAQCDAKVMLSGSGPTILGIVASQEDALDSRAALIEAGFEVVHVATGPVAGAHVVEYA